MAHVSALLAEAGRLHRDALRLVEAGAPAKAAAMLADARLLAEDAASYTLPSGMRLSVRATLAALDQQIGVIDAPPG